MALSMILLDVCVSLPPSQMDNLDKLIAREANKDPEKGSDEQLTVLQGMNQGQELSAALGELEKRASRRRSTIA